jgi:hypothetical protein
MAFPVSVFIVIFFVFASSERRETADGVTLKGMQIRVEIKYQA